MPDKDHFERRYELVFRVDSSGKRVGSMIHISEDRILFWANCEKLVQFFADKKAFGYEKGEIARLAQEYLNQNDLNQANTG